MNKVRELLIVAAIPAFNEEKTIAKVVLQTRKYANKVIVCDDGSSDCTAEIARELGADVVRHQSNCGYGAALQSLFRRAKETGADVMITLDGDGQHNPDEIPDLLNPIFEGKADIVIGSRFLGEMKHMNNVPKYRRIGIKAITRLVGTASSYGLSDGQSGFRVYGRKALESLRLYENGMGVSAESLMEAKKQGLIVVEVPSGCSYCGLERTSTQNPLGHGTSVVMSIVRWVVEERPLVFLGLPGVASLSAGVLFGVWMLQLYTLERRIVTNVALASVAFVLLGFFMLSTAITLYAIKRLAER